jgi:peptidoglycan hydrolase-like protein with peptidoglycan-binding domain
MERKGYQIDRDPGELNIVYVEGMNPDGTPNGDEANKWNDLRLVIGFEGGEPRIIGKWAATTEPGRYYTDHPLSPLGAARIEFGQYKSWQVGMHHPNKPSGHEALVQTGGQVTVCRDLNKDGLRTGDKRDTGEFGINQHWGYDLAEVDNASAGCLVGQSKNRKYVFASAILPESDVLAAGSPTVAPPAEQPGAEVPLASDVSENVRRWQKLLGFSEEEQDGIFGAITEEAVKRCQRRHGLTVTGEMDEKTRDALEREAAGAFGGSPTTVKPPEVVSPPEVRPIPAIPTLIPKIIPSIAAGVGAMNPLIALAAAVLPDILKAVVGDKAGAVAGAVTKAVTDVTRTQNPEEARKKLEADPAAAAELQLKLA